MRNRLAKAITYLGVFNWVAFFAVSIYLHGDALSGKVVAGHYFLGNHGRFTEVTKLVYIFSALHGYSALLGLLAVFGIAKWLRRGDVR